MRKPNELICTYHDRIISNARDISRTKMRDWDDLDKMIDYIIGLADEILSDANDALNCGQRMESRLQDYKDTIESLGFKRNK